MSRRIPLLLFLLALVSLGSMYVIYQLKYQGNDNYFNKIIKNISKRSPNPSPIALNSPPPHPLIPDDGTAGNFKVSMSVKDGPLFSTVRIDPLTDSLNTNIKIKTSIKSSREITSILGKVQSDNNSTPFNMKRISREGDTEIWEGEYTLNDTTNKTYILHFEASDGQINNKYLLPLRS